MRKIMRNGIYFSIAYTANAISYVRKLVGYRLCYYIGNLI